MPSAHHSSPSGAQAGEYFEPRAKLHRIPHLFEYLRAELGDEVELLHDVHERLAPIDAVWLAKAHEPYRLFFLEDIVAPESAVFHLPDNLSYVQGSLMEPLTVDVHVVKQAQLKAGQSVAILGTGSIGGLLAGVCRVYGLK